MVSSKIQLRKIRNLSDCINDVIQFLKQEFKPLMRGFLIICSAFIILAGIFSGIYNGSSTVGMWRDIFNGGQSDSFSYLNYMGPTYFFAFLFRSFSQASIYTYIACYFKAYEDNNGISPTTEQVWSIFKANYFSIFGYMLLIAIITILGFCFCIAPGVYLGVVFAPFGFIIVLDKEKRSGSVINTCFTLIKGNFWPTLGVYFICGLIYYICSSVVGLVVGGITGLISYFTISDMSYIVGLVTGILSIFSVLFSIIFYLGVGMQYFSLEELQNGTGLMDRIEGMGNSTDLTTNE